MSMDMGDWLTLLMHFATLSLLSVGSAITTAPDMHRYLVVQQHWLSDSQFSNSIALAQAAPGPNILFVALVGWHIGLNLGGSLADPWSWACGLLGVAVSMVGIMLPSTALTFIATRWGHQNRELRVVRAFKQGLAPIVIALLLATGWILASSHSADYAAWPLWLLSASTAVVVLRTRIHLLWLLGAGALAGSLGWV